MLGANEEKLIKSLLPEMSKILNVIPGEVFSSKDAETLMVLQRRLEESDLKNQLVQFNEIFSRQRGVGIPDITNCMIAYIRVKVLLEAGCVDFDGKAYRDLIKECRNQIERTTNIIRLSKANAMTAEEFQRDRINETIRKNEAFISCFENEIQSAEKKLERIPASFELETKNDNEEEITEVAPKALKVVEKKKSLIEQVEGIFLARQEKKYVNEHLRNEEKKQAETMCEEIPYYEKRLVFTEYLPCKDLGAYCILKKKNNIYFGLRAHVSKGMYDNVDQSLMELTNITDEVVQLMTEDVLNGEFKLEAFSEAEKKSLQMYLSFVTNCFEKHIGVTLNAQEYLAFKAYYNRLIDEGIRLEMQLNDNYYRAIPLADQYLFFMDSYNMIHSDRKQEVARQISIGANEKYLDSLNLILENHMVDKKAKERIKDLIHRIKFFLEPELVEEEQSEGLVITPKDFEEAQIKIQFSNDSGEVTDEATFACSNIQKAVADYMNKSAYIKKIGLKLKDKEIYLYGAKAGSLSVLLLTDKKKEIRGVAEGVQSQLVDFYVEQIKKLMTDYVEVEK